MCQVYWNLDDHLLTNFDTQPFSNFILEVGFGGGEHLRHQAELHQTDSKTLLIGVEPFLNGYPKTLAHAKTLGNIALYKGVFADAFDVLIGLQIKFSQIYILFPDPWPKSRHHKRRLINKTFLEQLVMIASPHCHLKIASDHEDYQAHILQVIGLQDAWQWQVEQDDDFLRPFANHQTTKYQQKAINEGRIPLYFSLTN